MVQSTTPVNLDSFSVHSGDSPKSSAELIVAFEQFTQLSDQLTNSYRNLEERIQILNGELSEASQQRVAALEAKEALADKLENLLDFLPGGVVVLDAKGFVVQTNPAAIEILGDKLIDHSWRDIIGKRFSPQQDDGHEISTVDGKRLSLATRSLADHGQIILLTDQTETRKLQDQLSRQERLSAMGKMMAALAHQIRTPLAAAMLYTDNLGHQQTDESRRKLIVDKLSQRLHAMEIQVRDMLLFVRGDVALNDTVLCNDLAHEWQSVLEPIQSQGVHVQWQLNTNTQKLLCNREVLLSALMNLINNSVQAIHSMSSESDEYPVINIAFKSERDILIIHITDNGPGFPQDIINGTHQTFDTKKPQGLGLGLSVVKTVIRAHGGNLVFRNTQQGACATIELPLID